MILIYLPPGPLHHAMEVSTRFRDTIKPTTPSGGNDMRVALGLRFSRRIEGMTESEHLALSLLEDAAKRGIFLYDLMDQILHRRFFWLMNVILDPRNTSFRREATHGSVPTLAVEPFNLVRIARGDHAGRGSKAGGNSYDENSRVMTLRFALPVKGNEKDAVTPRGIVKDGTLYRDNGRADWRGVTLLTMPFDVRICVDVDLREAMLAPLHHVGECQVPGCKVGVYGVQVGVWKQGGRVYVTFSKVTNIANKQKTSILIPAAHATVGNLVTFLDSVEFQALFNAKRIRHKTNKNGYREHGEWYYMGMLRHFFSF